MERTGRVCALQRPHQLRHVHVLGYQVADDGDFLGVVVPEGRQTVTFTFAPAGYAIGRAISLLAERKRLGKDTTLFVKVTPSSLVEGDLHNFISARRAL